METVIYRGIVAGIGDSEAGINLISPNLDAAIRNFIIGQNGIIDGFEYSSGKLTAGTVIAQGYVGILDEDIEIENTDLIYLEFNIYHDNSTPDEFFVIKSDNIREEYQDDILHGPGKFTIPLFAKKSLGIKTIYTDTKVNNRLYRGSITVNTSPDMAFNVVGKGGNDIFGSKFAFSTLISFYEWEITAEAAIQTNVTLEIIACIRKDESRIQFPYPLNAAHSDIANVVEPSDDVDINLQDGVTAVTQDIDDSSDRVANTEFVQKQIAKEIGTENVSFTNNLNNFISITVDIKYRARTCILSINIQGKGAQNDNLINSNNILLTIPEKYRPMQEVHFLVAYNYSTGTGVVVRYETLKIDVQGRIQAQNAFSFIQSQISAVNIGYETKVVQNG